MPSMSTALTPRKAPASARLMRTPMRRANNPKTRPAIADASEKVLTTVAAIVGLSPRSIRCGAWCRLIPACTGKTAAV